MDGASHSHSYHQPVRKERVFPLPGNLWQHIGASHGGKHCPAIWEQGLSPTETGCGVTQTDCSLEVELYIFNPTGWEKQNVTKQNKEQPRCLMSANMSRVKCPNHWIFTSRPGKANVGETI